MIKYISILLCVFSSLSFACGVHQDTKLHLVTEPGSLDVFGAIINARQQHVFNNANKPAHFQLYSIESVLSEPSQNKVDFVIFEAIKGHYLDVSIANRVKVKGRTSLPQADTLILVTELDVLDALTSNTISWEQAKERDLVRINGPSQESEQLRLWMEERFGGK